MDNIKHCKQNLISSHRDDSTIARGHPDVRIRLIENKYKDGQYELHAVAIDADTKRLLPGASYKEMTVRDPARLDNARKKIIARVTASLPSSVSAKSSSRRETARGAIETVYDHAYLLVKSNPSLIPEREASTRKSAFIWFERHFLPMLNEYCNDSALTLITGSTIQQWKAAEKQHIMAKKRRKSEITVQKTMAQHIQQVARIYEAMRQLNPSLPELDPSEFDTRGRRALELEQCKSIPKPIRQRLWRLIEAAAETEPRMAFCATVLACGGTRTAEAAGTLPQDVYVDGSFSIVSILHQEREGKRVDRLKTKNSYRLIPLPLWPTVMLQRCIRGMGSVSGNEPLVTTEELSAWVLNAFNKCGLTKDYIQALMQAENLFPDSDADAADMVDYDVVAYLLRRDRISVLRNYCGYTSYEADRFLGHRTIKLAQWAQEDLKLIEELRVLAYKAERYVFSTDPALTLLPAFAPISLSSNTKLGLPQFSRVRLHNDTQAPMVVTLDAQAYETGEEISLCLPSTPEAITLRSATCEPHPRLLIGNNITKEKPS